MQTVRNSFLVNVVFTYYAYFHVLWIQAVHPFIIHKYLQYLLRVMISLQLIPRSTGDKARGLPGWDTTECSCPVMRLQFPWTSHDHAEWLTVIITPAAWLPVAAETGGWRTPVSFVNVNLSRVRKTGERWPIWVNFLFPSLWRPGFVPLLSPLNPSSALAASRRGLSTLIKVWRSCSSWLAGENMGNPAVHNRRRLWRTHTGCHFLVPASSPASLWWTLTMAVGRAAAPVLWVECHKPLLIVGKADEGLEVFTLQQHHQVDRVFYGEPAMVPGHQAYMQHGVR